MYKIRGERDRVTILRVTISAIMSMSRDLGMDNRVRSKVSNS